MILNMGAFTVKCFSSFVENLMYIYVGRRYAHVLNKKKSNFTNSFVDFVLFIKERGNLKIKVNFFLKEITLSYEKRNQ